MIDALNDHSEEQISMINYHNIIIDTSMTRRLPFLKKNAIVLITGSKFFRGPPFSGGVLVPVAIMEKLISIQNEIELPGGLNTFIGKEKNNFFLYQQRIKEMKLYFGSSGMYFSG